MDELVILDFETTGLSPNYARIIEVGAIMVKDNKVIDSISQLMHPGTAIPRFITEITGITNQMIKGQPRPEKFMPILKKFIGKRPILAHNAPFDQKFLISEMQIAGREIDNEFLCTLKLARRLILDSPDHKLTTLVSHLKITTPTGHKAHRALNDVMMTLEIWLHMQQAVSRYIKTNPTLDLFLKLAELPKAKIDQFLNAFAQKSGSFV